MSMSFKMSKYYVIALLIICLSLIFMDLYGRRLNCNFKLSCNIILMRKLYFVQRWM